MSLMGLSLFVFFLSSWLRIRVQVPLLRPLSLDLFLPSSAQMILIGPCVQLGPYVAIVNALSIFGAIVAAYSSHGMRAMHATSLRLQYLGGLAW